MIKKMKENQNQSITLSKATKLIGQIVEGWRNKIIPPKELEDLINVTSKYRLEICGKCEHHSKNFDSLRIDAHCNDCGCTLSAKTACLSCKCPLTPPKWGEVIVKTKAD
jgi:PHP family Zn ribbon phosphoesterase